MTSLCILVFEHIWQRRFKWHVCMLRNQLTCGSFRPLSVARRNVDHADVKIHQLYLLGAAFLFATVVLLLLGLGRCRGVCRDIVIGLGQQAHSTVSRPDECRFSRSSDPCMLKKQGSVAAGATESFLSIFQSLAMLVSGARFEPGLLEPHI